jgi:hypothetical protein
MYVCRFRKEQHPNGNVDMKTGVSAAHRDRAANILGNGMVRREDCRSEDPKSKGSEGACCACLDSVVGVGQELGMEKMTGMRG